MIGDGNWKPQISHPDPYGVQVVGEETENADGRTHLHEVQLEGTV